MWGFGCDMDSVFVHGLHTYMCLSAWLGGSNSVGCAGGLIV